MGLSEVLQCPALPSLIFSNLHKSQDLVSLSLSSKSLHPHANKQLYARVGLYDAVHIFRFAQSICQSAELHESTVGQTTTNGELVQQLFIIPARPGIASKRDLSQEQYHRIYQSLRRALCYMPNIMILHINETFRIPSWIFTPETTTPGIPNVLEAGTSKLGDLTLEGLRMRWDSDTKSFIQRQRGLKRLRFFSANSSDYSQPLGLVDGDFMHLTTLDAIAPMVTAVLALNPPPPLRELVAYVRGIPPTPSKTENELDKPEPPPLKEIHPELYTFIHRIPRVSSTLTSLLISGLPFHAPQAVAEVVRIIGKTCQALQDLAIVPWPHGNVSSILNAYLILELIAI